MKNEYRVTWELYKKWVIENKLKGARLAITILWSIYTIVALYYFFVWNFKFFLLIALFCVYRAVIRDFVVAKKQYNLLAKTYGGKNWLRTITISDEGIYVNEGNISVNCPKTDIAQVKEKDDKIWIVLHNKQVIRLYKSAFTEGSWTECKELLK